MTASAPRLEDQPAEPLAQDSQRTDQIEDRKVLVETFLERSNLQPRLPRRVIKADHLARCRTS